MEILASSAMVEFTWHFQVLVVLAIAAGIISTVGFSTDYPKIGIIGLIVVIVCIVLIFILPATRETDTMKYTVEITDADQFKILAQKGYTFKQLFENKEIYEIVGEVLK